jgi:ribonucleoside-diphosphate reductase alpha chain
MTVAVSAPRRPVASVERRRLPRVRPSYTVSFEVGGAEGTLTAGAHLDGALGEIFLRLGKQGSTLAGLAEAFGIVTSLALQYGAPLEVIVERLRGLRFEPAGLTDDDEIPQATSVMDYVVRRLAADFAPTVPACSVP